MKRFFPKKWLYHSQVLLILVLISLSCCQDNHHSSDKKLDETVINLPERPPNALTGSELVNVLKPLDLRSREARILSEILSGNIPDFLRELVPVTYSANIGDSSYTAIAYTMCDYMALGSDSDYFLIPMTPILAQELADSLRMSLMTRKMVDRVWLRSDLKLEPQPIPPTDTMATVPVFAAHNTMVHEQRFQHIAAYPLGSLVAGHKKDVILSNRILTHQNKVVIYGWHQLNGVPIQPIYSGHVNWYADYSHGIRFVSREVVVNGEKRDIRDILTDSELYPLLSDESGPMGMPYYLVDKSSYPP